MLVALPSAIALGVTIYAAIGPTYAAAGALAGIIGATVIGLVASTFGGTDRLISAPCAPAAAVLSAFAIELVRQGITPDTILLLLIILGVMAGIIQMLLGFVGIGKLIKYIPYPVVSGYMSGVGLIIIGSQIPHLLGTSTDMHWYRGLLAPELWDWRGVVIGGATVVVALVAPRVIKKIPGTILGILAGIVTYFLLAWQDPVLWAVVDNPLVVGPLGVAKEGYVATTSEHWREIGELRLNQIAGLLGNALMLSVLLSIDTLKTCVVLDQLTRSRHESNRELIAQGIGNVSSAIVGGIPGSGIMGATLVNLASGAQTRMSGVIEGVLTLVAAFALGAFIAWIPVAALAGILIVIGVRMIDLEPLKFIESRATVFDFAVVIVVIVVALTVGLLAASAMGVAMAIVLFVREQIGGSVVRHKIYVNQTSSNWHRPESEMCVLEQKGDQGVIFELQGSIFFGTTQQLYTELEAELSVRNFVIIDFRRVQSVDVTAAHLLRNVRDILQERGATLILSNVRERLPNGRNLRQFLEQTGVAGSDNGSVEIFPELDNAIEWVEDRILGEDEQAIPEEAPLQLQEMELFRNYKDETLQDLESRMEQRSYKAGQPVYARGDAGDELYWVRRGTVRVFAPLGLARTKHIATFGRGEFFGGNAFLDAHPHNNDAIALTDTELYVLTREQYQIVAEHHRKLAFNLVAAIAQTLSVRLQRANSELAVLEEY